MGGTYRYWFIFPFDEFQEVDFEITLINLEARSSFETKNYKDVIKCSNVRFIDEVGDACKMKGKEDNSYHLSHNNSVIEHVQSWYNIKRFASETLRIGKYHFVQTPNYWFPIEPHYFLPLVHFFPRPIHTQLIIFFKKRSFNVATENFESNRMLSKREFKYLFNTSQILYEKFFLFNKSLIATSKIEQNRS